MNIRYLFIAGLLALLLVSVLVIIPACQECNKYVDKLNGADSETTEPDDDWDEAKWGPKPEYPW